MLDKKILCSFAARFVAGLGLWPMAFVKHDVKLPVPLPCAVPRKKKDFSKLPEDHIWVSAPESDQ